MNSNITLFQRYIYWFDEIQTNVDILRLVMDPFQRMVYSQIYPNYFLHISYNCSDTLTLP